MIPNMNSSYINSWVSILVIFEPVKKICQASISKRFHRSHFSQTLVKKQAEKSLICRVRQLSHGIRQVFRKYQKSTGIHFLSLLKRCIHNYQVHVEVKVFK